MAIEVNFMTEVRLKSHETVETRLTPEQAQEIQQGVMYDDEILPLGLGLPTGETAERGKTQANCHAVSEAGRLAHSVFDILYLPSLCICVASLDEGGYTGLIP